MAAVCEKNAGLISVSAATVCENKRYIRIVTLEILMVYISLYLEISDFFIVIRWYRSHIAYNQHQYANTDK
jgi:hypothetical protein